MCTHAPIFQVALVKKWWIYSKIWKSYQPSKSVPFFCPTPYVQVNMKCSSKTRQFSRFVTYHIRLQAMIRYGMKVGFEKSNAQLSLLRVKLLSVILEMIWEHLGAIAFAVWNSQWKACFLYRSTSPDNPQWFASRSAIVVQCQCSEWTLSPSFPHGDMKVVSTIEWTNQVSVWL